jgi:hypothetical protein
MVQSFKETVHMNQKKKLVKRNALLADRIRKMNIYTASINTLSDVISYVTRKRRKENTKRQFITMIKSRTNN